MPKLNPVVLPTSSTAEKKKVKYCCFCENICNVVVTCLKCFGGCYCSESYRTNHESDHAHICNMIQQLTAQELQKRVFSVRETGQVKVKAWTTYKDMDETLISAVYDRSVTSLV